MQEKKEILSYFISDYSNIRQITLYLQEIWRILDSEKKICITSFKI